MKRFLCITILLASRAWADEATDRTDIAQTISELSSLRPDAGLFTADFDGSTESIRSRVTGRVLISKAPWGEAVWVPGTHGPRFLVRSTRFVTADVALVDGIDRQTDGSPVLAVLKREGSSWKIA